MNILVAGKRVVDPYVSIRVRPDESGVETEQVKMAMNPFDEIALEEAIRLLEQGLVEDILVLSIGDSQETLRHALALGATRAILVETKINHCSLNIAKILQHFVLKEEIDLVLMGKQAIDGDNNQTTQMLAALLDWPQATNASKLHFKDGALEVTREIDGGLETLELILPAVVSADLRLNEPRYASLPNIMKAKRKPLEVVSLESLNLNLRPRRDILSVKAPSVRKEGIILDSVEALLDKLREEAQIL